jgi:hypothetical protein
MVVCGTAIKMPYSNPEKQKEAKRNWARNQRAEAQALKALSRSLSTDEQIQVKNLLDAGKPQAPRVQTRTNAEICLL